jgi:hypothetical protein
MKKKRKQNMKTNNKKKSLKRIGKKKLPFNAQTNINITKGEGSAGLRSALAPRRHQQVYQSLCDDG